MKYIVALFICLSVFPVTSKAGELPDPRSSISEEKLLYIAKEAVSGNHEYSYWLSEYFIDGISNAKEGEFWLRLSAEQGDCRGVREYSRFVKSQYGSSGFEFKNATRISKNKCNAVID